MSGLLFGVGAVAVVVGAVMVGFGIPINEFSFGNTLIVAGTTAAVGGLIVIGLGVVVTQLQRIAEALATRAPVRPSRPLDTFEAAAGSRAAPVPAQAEFRSRPSRNPNAGIREPHASSRAWTARRPICRSTSPAAHSFAPTLRNPEEPPVTVEDDVSLSPQQPMAAARLRPIERMPTAWPNATQSSRRSMPAGGRRRLRPLRRDRDSRTPHISMPCGLPSPSRPRARPAAKRSLSRNSICRRVKPPPRRPSAPSRMRRSSVRQASRAAVAILKSGVVDGMGYTLYVDGSIEAELPQGTLRFASINELRSHLEKNS